jgi:hypothetical protein
MQIWGDTAVVRCGEEGEVREFSGAGLTQSCEAGSATPFLHGCTGAFTPAAETSCPQRQRDSR